MPYPDRVIGRMVSSLWAQLASTAPVAPPVGGNIGTPPTHFGKQERIPEMTYIVNALPSDNGFIASATTYHQTYGLNPQSFNSLEALIGAIRNPSTHIGRLRVVGHVGLGDDSGNANLNVAFFNGGPRVVTEDMLKGFGTSDEIGLRAIFSSFFNSISYSAQNPSSPVFPDLTGEFVQVLTSMNPAVLEPFGDVSASNLSGHFKQVMFACSDIVYARLAPFTDNNGNTSNSNRNAIVATFQLMFEKYKDKVVGTTVHTAPARAQDLNALRTAVEGITKLQLIFLSQTFPIFNDLTNGFLNALRGDASASTIVDTNFCLQNNGPAANSDLELFFYICSDLYFVQESSPNDLKMGGTNLTPTQRTELRTALTIAADVVKDRMVNTTICGAVSLQDTDIDDLKTKILGYSLAEVGLTSVGNADYPFPGQSFNFGSVPIYDILRSANAAMGRDFRNRINAVKARFDENSWIDFRGCRIGQDPDYLEALRIFFGRTGHLPSVSGPEWYQSFPIAAGVTLSNEAEVDTLFGNGDNQQGQNHTSQQVQDVFDEVRDLVGLETHMDFWENVTDLSDFAFAAMVWKGDLPVLPMEAPRLSGFAGLDFSDTIARIGQIFDESTNAPSNAILTRIEAQHAAMAALQSEFETIQQLASQPSPSAPDLNASYQRLRTISTGQGLTIVPNSAPGGMDAAQLQSWANELSEHFHYTIIRNDPGKHTLHVLPLRAEMENIQQLIDDGGTPTAGALASSHQNLLNVSIQQGLSIVPDPAPPGMDLAQLQTWGQQLEAHFQPLLNTTDTALNTFKMAVHAKVRIDRTTSIGAAGNARSDFRYFFFIGLPLLVEPVGHWCFYIFNAVRDDSIRSFMRAQWQDALPGGNSVGTARATHNRARQLSVLSEDDLDDYVNPYPDFNDHIITRP